jgi:hypothetical protein
VWERSFFAVSVLLGASLEEALAALPDAGGVGVAALERKLRDPRRAVRAQALAIAAHEVAAAISEVTLR